MKAVKLVVVIAVSGAALAFRLWGIAQHVTVSWARPAPPPPAAENGYRRQFRSSAG